MKKLLISIAVLAMSLCGMAQAEKLPIDEAVRVGHLDNGLTYYIRHNEQPKQRCDFHIAQSVGAILEEDNQNGLAHFLEHMAFNGTEHFPGKGIIEYFESIGVNFGGNINAYTSLDETVYRLSDVPTYREGIVDSALLVMHDWACGLSLIGEEIDNERGVIREEWRTRSDASRRMWSEAQRKMFPQSQYAKRDIIGDTAVINNFAYQALRDYYHKWYGPDNQAIIVVGDIDVDQVEQKIKALWSNVPARQNRGERPIYSVDDNKEPIIAVVKDKEAQSTTIRIICKHNALPEQLRGTDMEYVRDLMYNIVYLAMAERFDEIKIDPNSPIRSGAAYYTNLVKEKDGFLMTAAAKDGHETEAYQLLLNEMERLIRYGLTEAEVERAKAEGLSQMEAAYNERSTRKNIALAREYIRHFLDGTVIPGVEWEYNFYNRIAPQINAQLVNRYVSQLVNDENIIVCFQGPDKEGVNIPDETTALAMLLDRKNIIINAPKEEIIDANLVKKAPRMGRIKKVIRENELGATEWLLGNGIRVIIRPTEFKQDEIIMRAYSQGGTSLIKNIDDLPSAKMAASLVSFMGYGDYSMNELKKKLTGKQCSTDFSISEYGENITGSSTIKDLETMLQLTYLGFTAPRRDEQAYQTVMSIMRQQLANYEKNHKAIWKDSISMQSTNHSQRNLLFDEDFLNKVNLDKALKIYKERFKNPADFTFVFVGNINPNDIHVQDLICRWLGGMKTCGKQETYIDHKERVTPGECRNYFTRDMQVLTASNYIQYTSYDVPYTLANDVNLEMIGRILSTRYLESIREREGGSYGVGCSGSLSLLPIPNAKLRMQFDTDPLKQTRLMQIIHEEVKTIAQNGPLATDLQKEKESMLKDLQEDVEKNSWWMTTLYMYYRWNINYVKDYSKAVENITAKSVQDLLNQVIASGNVMEVVMSPAE